jgi:hypothetical protein
MRTSIKGPKRKYVMLVDSDRMPPRLSASVWMFTRLEPYQYASICEWNQIEVRTLTSGLSMLTRGAGCCARVNHLNMEIF